MNGNVVWFVLIISVVVVTFQPIASCQTSTTYNDTEALSVCSVLMPSSIGGKTVFSRKHDQEAGEVFTG